MPRCGSWHLATISRIKCSAGMERKGPGPWGILEYNYYKPINWKQLVLAKLTNIISNSWWIHIT